MAQPLTPEQEKREELQILLETLVPAGAKVYFQPTVNVKMVYPCIMYQRDDTDTNFADNISWRRVQRYQVTIIDEDPDSDIPIQVSKLSMSIFERHFTQDDLNHDIYRLYY